MIVTIFKEEKKTEEKWTDWVTTDINIEVRGRGLYPQARGVVFDIITDDLVCVFLNVLNEMVTLPPDHIKPLQPKVKEKVKVLKGDDRGKTGVLLSIQNTKGIVKLYASKDVKMFDLQWLASVPSADAEDNSSLDVEETCLLTLSTSDSSSRLNL